jgi:hypothetical protein
MPWRLVGFILLLGVLLGFIGFNLENTCDISFGFKVIPGVPVYLTAFVGFVLGMLCSLPLVISSRFKKNKSRLPAGGSGPDTPGKPSRKWGKGKNSPEPGSKEGGGGDDGHDGAYGID